MRLRRLYAYAARGRGRPIVDAPYNPRTLFCVIKIPEHLTIHGSVFGSRHRVGCTEAMSVFLRILLKYRGK